MELRSKSREKYEQAFSKERIFLSLGTNIGDRICNLKRAIQKIRLIPTTQLVTLSSVYETAPVGFTDQPDFLNLIIEIRTSLCPICLLFELQRIENEIGRIRTVRWGPRRIDIDLIYYGQIVRESLILTVPHGEAMVRRFVLKPLSEIASDFMPPSINCTISQLLDRCLDHNRVTKLYNATEFLETH